MSHSCHRRYDLVGKEYNLLKVISFAGNSKNGKSLWNCVCKCGGTKTTLGQSIVEGRVTCCGQDGCIGLKFGKDSKSYKHGLIHTPEYGIWGNIVSRCTNKKSHAWHHYGGRGIKCCERWKDFISFYEDMGERPSPEYEIDRVDNDGDYCKENCKWATRAEQLRNTRRNTLVEYEGKKQKLILLADKYGIDADTVMARIKRGWSVYDALNKPLIKYPKQGTK